jgi:cell wall-associated NlpC family hydrolase
MQRLKQKLKRPKYKFWLGLIVSGFLLLLEIIPRTAAFAAKATAATKLPRENDIRDAVVRGAQSYLNLPYIFGGASPTGFDCSGLVLYLYNQQGFTMPHGVIHMRPTLKLTKNPQKGDVIFFFNDNGIAGHVGIYIDEERFIHAPKEGAVIRYEKLKHPYWQKRFVEIRSVL